MAQEVHFMSDRHDWGTPDSFMIWLKEEMGLEFDLDAAASDDNHKAPEYFSIEDDALSCNWYGKVWLNPPFGNELPLWLDKCAREIRREDVESIHVLIPARTDTRWFHDIVMPKASMVYFIKGRFNFRFDRAIAGANAPFPSMLVLFAKWGGDRRQTHSVMMPLPVPKEARGFGHEN